MSEDAMHGNQWMWRIGPETTALLMVAASIQRNRICCGCVWRLRTTRPAACLQRGLRDVARAIGLGDHMEPDWHRDGCWAEGYACRQVQGALRIMGTFASACCFIA